MGELVQLPQFVRDAISDGESSDVLALAEVLETGVASMLEPVEPTQAAFERLQLALTRPQHRYAPFCARLAELFDLTEEAALAELTRLGQRGVWRFAGLPGIQNVEVRAGAAVASAETLFVKFAPGTRFPRHHHVGLERTLVLEGEYTDSAGIVHRAGEVREWLAGTQHAFRVGDAEPCVFASVTYGRRFHARPLRVLARLMGR